LTFEPGSTLRRVENWALYGVLNLKHLCIPASVESIGSDSFYPGLFRKSSLSSLTFESHSKLRQIRMWAFHGCKYLTSICIPASVSKMDGTTFLDSSLSTVAIEAGNQHFCVREHLILDIREVRVLWHFGSEATVQIPDGIETIDRSAFRSHTSIRSVSFGPHSRLQVIEPNAFGWCSGLRMMNFPASLRELRERAFFRCTDLSVVTFGVPSALTRIEARCFESCHALRAIHVPSSVEFIGESALSDCSSFSTLTFEQPSHLRELRGLPTTVLGSVDIPDSVEVLTTDMEREDRLPNGRRTIRFGEGSKLEEMKFRETIATSGKTGGLRAFVRIPAHRLKVIRDKGEFVG
jgi:hypothetical protein